MRMPCGSGSCERRRLTPRTRDASDEQCLAFILREKANPSTHAPYAEVGNAACERKEGKKRDALAHDAIRKKRWGSCGPFSRSRIARSYEPCRGR